MDLPWAGQFGNRLASPDSWQSRFRLEGWAIFPPCLLVVPARLCLQVVGRDALCWRPSKHMGGPIFWKNACQSMIYGIMSAPVARGAGGNRSTAALGFAVKVWDRASLYSYQNSTVNNVKKLI